MIELVLIHEDIALLRAKLIGHATELCAVLYARQVVREDGTVRLLVRKTDFAQPSDYIEATDVSAELKPEFVAKTTKKARRGGYSLIFVHSHPGDAAPEFSLRDNHGELELAAFLRHRHPDATHLALVLSAGGARSRQLGTDTAARVISVGSKREVLFDPEARFQFEADVFDRQVRAFGATGQEAIGKLRVAIVGLGGTGSVVAQQLAHLGVRDFILIDPDTLETTNLNRVANAKQADVGRLKVRVAGDYIRSVSVESQVLELDEDIIRARVAKQLLNADFIFGCTDSHGSRAVIQQVAYQYLIPCIDLGTTIVVDSGTVTHIYGRVQMLSPELACFTCDGLLNSEEVRRDMMTSFERKADPYIQGAREPAPAVMAINGTVASLAVTMFLNCVTEVPGNSRHLLYNAVTSKIRSVRATPVHNCYICSHLGALAEGNAWPLFSRQD